MIASGENSKDVKKEIQQMKPSGEPNEKDEDNAIADYSQSLVSIDGSDDKSKQTNQTQSASEDEPGSMKIDMVDQILSNGKSVEFWSQQNDEETKKQLREVQLAKNKKEEQDKQEKLINQKLNSMSQAEKEKLQHEAIHNALTEIKAKGEEEPTDKTELLDFDEADAGNWEGAEEYTKYMLNTEANAKENEKKKLEPKKVEKKLN